MSAGGTLSLAQHPGDLAHYGVEHDTYSGPAGGTSYQKGFRTSQQGAGQFSHESGTGFTTKNLQGGRFAGGAATNRKSIVDWDAESPAPGFQQN